MTRKGIKQLLTITLVFMLVFALATGCSKPADTKATPTPAPTEQATPEPTEEATPEPTPEAIDLGGYEFIFASHWIGEFFPEEGASEDGDKLLERYREIEEKYNCKITPISMGPEELVPNVIAAAMAGDKYADIIDANLGWFQALRSGGYLADLNTVPGIDLNDPRWNPAAFPMTTYDGKVFGMQFKEIQPRAVLFFNKSLMEREGQPDIYELFRNKEWTWDKFREIMRNITKDTDGDNINDIWGITTIGDGLEKQAIWSNGARVVKNDGGKYVFGLNDPAAHEALQFVYEIINVDKFYKFQAEGTDWTQPAYDFMEGNVGFFAMEFWFAPVWGAPEMQDDYGIVPFPMGPQATDYVSQHADQRFFCMTSTNSDLDKAAIIWNAICEPFEGTSPDDWKEVYRNDYLCDDESLETILYLFDGRVDLDLSVGVPGMDFGGAIASVTRTGENTPKAAMEAIVEINQTAIDEFYNK